MQSRMVYVSYELGIIKQKITYGRFHCNELEIYGFLLYGM